MPGELAVSFGDRRRELHGGTPGPAMSLAGRSRPGLSSLGDALSRSMSRTSNMLSHQRGSQRGARRAYWFRSEGARRTGLFRPLANLESGRLDLLAARSARSVGGSPCQPSESRCRSAGWRSGRALVPASPVYLSGLRCGGGTLREEGA